ncbi:MAG: YidC/Oxa1 family membrane protein insertase [Clostridia bacterium]|nr:YidC/Oxa1 family membrane protein insertase [Clostridia bacterium]
MFDFLLKPLGWILQQFAELFGGSFAWSVFMFTLVVNLLMIPLSIKTQKSSVAQMRIRPKMEALKKKYGDDKQRYSTELQKLYQEENVSMSGGCLPMLIRLPIMLGVYQVVLSPLKYIAGVSTDLIQKATDLATKAGIVNNTAYPEVDIINNLGHKGLASVSNSISQEMGNINFNFFGINLTDSPKFDINIFSQEAGKGFEPSWIIPILAFAAAMLTSIVSMQIQKRANPDAPRMGGMMLTMPFISLFIGFSVSCAAGFYWACSSLISGAIQSIIQIYYGPNKIIAAEQAKDLLKRHKEEQAIKAKKANTPE